jgi:catechol 2,3-dioxygenase-like lactoylglutathione lyase family enzyme
MNLNQVTMRSNDIPASVEFYRRMGFTLIVSSPHYARFQSTSGDTTFSVHESNDPVRGETTIYLECESLDEQVEKLRSRGIEFTQLPQHESWLWRAARLRDPSGNVICLYYAGENRLNPPWRINAE